MKMKDKIIFLVIGILIGLCSFFLVHLRAMNSGIGEIKYLLQEKERTIDEIRRLLHGKTKITENEFVLLSRRCVKINSLLDDLTKNVQHMKDNTLGETVKIGNEWYFKGGMYGKVGAISTNVSRIDKKLNNISMELNNVSMELSVIKQNVGSEFSITGISGKIDEIKKELNKIKTDIGSDYSITGISGKIDGIQQDINLIKLKLNL